eukprot:5232222-Heterocapsa_arctica.AAC.1
MEPAKLGAVILSMKEAMDVIEEELTIADQYTTDRDMIISVVMEFDQNNPEEDRAAFKFFKRCDIRDTANFLRIMNYMDIIEANLYTIAEQGTYSEHSLDVEATILESILGLGAIFAEHGFADLEDLPDM